MYEGLKNAIPVQELMFASPFIILTLWMLIHSQVMKFTHPEYFILAENNNVSL